jgi:NADH dehydrogenase/NADH:ubiquinone oxidoreductase subunit G
MAEIMDTFQQNIEQPRPDVQKIARVAATGKARPGAPVGTRIGAQAAEAAAKAEAKKLAVTGEMAQAKIGQQKEFIQRDVDRKQEELVSNRRSAMQELDVNNQIRINESTSKISQQLSKIAQQFGLTKDNILTKFSQDKRELADREDAAQLEQVGFLLGLQDKEYVATMKQIADERQLYDEANFKEEMLNTVLGDKFALFLDDIGFRKEVMLENDLRFLESMEKMSLKQILDLSEIDAEAARESAIWNGITEVGIGTLEMVALKGK